MASRLVMKTTTGLHRNIWRVHTEHFQKRERWHGYAYLRPVTVVLFGPDRLIAEGRLAVSKLKGGLPVD